MRRKLDGFFMCEMHIKKRPRSYDPGCFRCPKFSRQLELMFECSSVHRANNLFDWLCILLSVEDIWYLIQRYNILLVYLGTVSTLQSVQQPNVSTPGRLLPRETKERNRSRTELLQHSFKHLIISAHHTLWKFSGYDGAPSRIFAASSVSSFGGKRLHFAVPACINHRIMAK